MAFNKLQERVKFAGSSPVHALSPMCKAFEVANTKGVSFHLNEQHDEFKEYDYLSQKFKINIFI